MVFSADEAEDNDYSPAEFTAATKRKRRDMDMEVGQQRPRTAARWSLQNFSSAPTLDITWGCQRQLRCVKDRDAAAAELTHSELYSDFRKRRSSSLSDDGDDGGGGIDAVREKLMLDLRAEVNQMQADLFKGGKHSVSSSAMAAATTVEPRPWNLRTRRAVCKDPTNSQSNINGGSGFDRKPSFSPAKTSDVKSPAKIGTSFGGGGGGGGDEKGKRTKFAVALSKQQIEEDFLALTGARPARRPKKRAKCVQRQIDVMFPGYWLTEVTADMYKVNEQPPDGSKK